MEFLQLRTLKAYRLLGSTSHTTVLGPCTRSVALQTPLSSPSSWDAGWLGPLILEVKKIIVKKL